LLAKAGAEAITPAATSAEINTDFMLNSLLCEKWMCRAKRCECYRIPAALKMFHIKKSTPPDLLSGLSK
jgi:hypothetical protein